MTDFTPLMPHGELEEVFPDIFFVTGTSRPKFGDQAWQFSRNMTVVRDRGELTLINTVRLDDARLAKLDGLGKVTKVVTLGSFHGIDDPFYNDRYAAELWAPAGMKHDKGLPIDVDLVPGGTMPFPGCDLFSFETCAKPEAILVIDREGGILVSCDSLQNWVEVDQYFDEDTGKKMTELGFIKPANIGPGWLRASEPQPSDFARLLKLPFRHLLSAHGPPLRDTAHEQLSKTFVAQFGTALG